MELLVEGAKRLGLTLTRTQIETLDKLYRLLVEWNAQFNLTAITEYDQVQIRHFLDSLSCVLALRGQTGQDNKPLSCIDVGSGAGFPGLVLKIYCPKIDMTLLEATGKKVEFIEFAIQRLGLKRIRAIKGRAEELGQSPEHRERYDVAVARAVAELPVLVEYLLPLCRPGGLVVAQKGASAQEEIQAAEHAIALLGGRLRKVLSVELLGLAEARNLVLIDKVARTPDKYPRRPGMPVKRPLKPD